ncbi:MAG TPA: sulfite exporter TauE/SafE family protein [Opitutus sp.]|nr:sulfite exporter TauE/SafE family protein [Opitutus sp.]
MDLSAVNSPAAAFVAGLVTSLHCAGMCGPLACGLMPVRGDAADAHAVATTYHLTRLASYSLLGGLAGGLGTLPLSFVSSTVLRYLPWLVVLFFIALAFRLDRHLPKPAALGRLSLRLSARFRGRSRVQAAAALGFATPLLPCGPLYFLITLAFATGSALGGIEFMLAFGLGTVPLLWLAQSQFHWVRRKLSPLWLDRTRLALALVSAAAVGWRLRATLGFPGPDPTHFLCH